MMNKLGTNGWVRDLAKGSEAPTGRPSYSRLAAALTRFHGSGTRWLAAHSGWFSRFEAALAPTAPGSIDAHAPGRDRPRAAIVNHTEQYTSGLPAPIILRSARTAASLPQISGAGPDTLMSAHSGLCSSEAFGRPNDLRLADNLTDIEGGRRRRRSERF